MKIPRRLNLGPSRRRSSCLGGVRRLGRAARTSLELCCCHVECVVVAHHLAYILCLVVGSCRRLLSRPHTSCFRGRFKILSVGRCFTAGPGLGRAATCMVHARAGARTPGGRRRVLIERSSQARRLSKHRPGETQLGLNWPVNALMREAQRSVESVQSVDFA
jgi:hypothetical protein